MSTAMAALTLLLTLNGLTTSSISATIRGELRDGQAFSDNASITVISGKGGGRLGRNSTKNTQATLATDAYFAELGSKKK